MNEIVSNARTQVEALVEVAQRLSAVAESESTTMCADQEANQEFNAAVTSAEEAVQAAMDEVSGPALTAFDYALDDLRLARQAYFTPVVANRRTTSDHVASAFAHVESGIAQIDE